MTITPATTKLLIVDDYQTMLRVIRNLLEQIGFKDIDEALDGTATLTKIEMKQSDMIISDWNMEPMTGINLLKTIRKKGSKPPFIMITAESKTDNIIAAKQAGVNNYIVKPFNATTLKSQIIAVLGAF